MAQGAYYIESNGEVAIIDPLRETQHYIDKATANKATIKYIFETHIHADFVSGHVDLAKKTERNNHVIFHNRFWIIFLILKFSKNYFYSE